MSIACEFHSEGEDGLFQETNHLAVFRAACYGLRQGIRLESKNEKTLTMERGVLI